MRYVDAAVAVGYAYIGQPSLASVYVVDAEFAASRDACSAIPITNSLWVHESASSPGPASHLPALSLLVYGAIGAGQGLALALFRDWRYLLMIRLGLDEVRRSCDDLADLSRR